MNAPSRAETHIACELRDSRGADDRQACAGRPGSVRRDCGFEIDAAEGPNLWYPYVLLLDCTSLTGLALAESQNGCVTMC